MKKIFSLDIKIVCITGIVLCIAIFFLVSAYYAYPAAGGDSLFFTQPAINFASGQGLRIPFFIEEWGIDDVIDTTGQRRFLHYPPLFPLSLGTLMPSPTPRGAFTVLAFMNIAVIALSAVFLFKAGKQNNQVRWSSLLLVGLALLGVATTADQSMGRPEILARLFFALGLFSIFCINQKWHWLILGVLLGLMGATHPAAGFMSALLLAIFFAAKYRWKKALAWTFASSLVSLLVFLTIIRIGPFTLTETLTAMVKIGKVANAYLVENEVLNPKIFLTHYFLDPGAPFIGIITLLFLAEGIIVYKRKKHLIASPVMFFASIIPLILVIMWLMLYTVGHQMYITVFSPLLFGGLVYYAARSGACMKMCTALVILVSASGIARDMVFFPSFLERGVTLVEAREKFQETQSRAGEGNRLGVTSALWTLSEQYNQMYTYSWPDPPKKNTAAIFLQQAYGGRVTPPEIEGCGLVENRFQAPPKIFGLKAGNSLRDYAYALYKCGL